MDSGEATEEALAPFTGALRQAITPLLDQQSALAETLSRSVLASIPKIDMSLVMKPLFDQQSALGKALSASAFASIPKIDTSSMMKPLLDQQSALAETLSASFATIDMSPVLKPLLDQQSTLAEAVGASTLASFAKIDMSSVLKPLIDAADSFATIPGLVILGPDLTSRAEEWLAGFDDEVQREARDLAASIADEVGLSQSDPVAPLLLAAILITLIASWRIEIDLHAAAIGAVRSAVVTGRFAMEFAEQVDERLPHIQNLHLWLLIMLHALRSKRSSAGERRLDDG